MQIQRMAAYFGKLHGDTLTFKPGLNIIQAPNETGKSTWCAFLLAMLYGINSRERDRAGALADKNRYAPWSGESMAGRIDCVADGRELTLMRATRRASSPMGEFRALYAGTGEAVPDLTGAACGETLLGVSREVFERSAFIRQSGLSVTQDAELERRIAALITSGEEDTSYSEAVDLLKKQLYARRHNRTGRIPALETQLQEQLEQIRAAESLTDQLTEANLQADRLARRKAELEEQLAQAEAWDAAQRRQELTRLEAEAETARQTAGALRLQLQMEHIPEGEDIARLRAALFNLSAANKTLEKARQHRDETAKALLAAEAAASEGPFAGKTAEQARREAHTPPKVTASPALPLLLSVLLLAAGSAAVYFGKLSPVTAVLPCAAAAALFVILYRRAGETARTAALIRRFGTADAAGIADLAEGYVRLLEQRDAAQAAAAEASAAAKAVYETVYTNEQAILLEVRRFAPGASSAAAADELLRRAAVRRKELNNAETAARETALRRDLLAQQLAADNVPITSDVRPFSGDRAALRQELEQVEQDLAVARSAADRLAGQLNGLEDPNTLRASARELYEERSRLQQEYDALQLAMDTLTQVNTQLQTRFSPALGRRTAEIFRELTDGRYTGVVFDHDLHLSAEPAGDTAYREALRLSAGTVDQLYLAARLAICELVLPADRSVPIVLDDALANFDDARCAAALRWLRRAAADRQILLFTCHSREAAFFAHDDEVSIQQLTAQAHQV